MFLFAIGICLTFIVLAFIEAGTKAKIILAAASSTLIILYLFPPSLHVRYLAFAGLMLLGAGCILYLKWNKLYLS